MIRRTSDCRRDMSLSDACCPTLLDDRWSLHCNAMGNQPGRLCASKQCCPGRVPTYSLQISVPDQRWDLTDIRSATKVLVLQLDDYILAHSEMSSDLLYRQASSKLIS